TAVPDRATSKWRREIEGDPLALLRAVRQPILVMFGATDPVVPVAQSAAEIRRLQASHRNIQLAVIAGADHGMQTAGSARDLLDPAQLGGERPEAPEYFARLAAWLSEVGATAKA